MSLKGPKKGAMIGMCKHIDLGESDTLHWYKISAPANRSHPDLYAWACLCPACFVKAEQNPKAPLPVAAYDVLEEDVVIDKGG